MPMGRKGSRFGSKGKLAQKTPYRVENPEVAPEQNPSPPMSKMQQDRIVRGDGSSKKVNTTSPRK
jgi:hypothetical protein